MNATKASLDQSVKPGHEMRTGSLSKISVHQVHAPQHQRPSVGYILEYAYAYLHICISACSCVCHALYVCVFVCVTHTRTHCR